MLLLGIFLTELVALFFISHRLTSILYSLFYFVTKSRSASFAFLTFLYLPGTVVHEFGHLIIAEILRVPTGNISFSPELDPAGEKTELQLGELKIGATDPFRRFLIGISPLLFGIAFLMLLVWLFQYFWPEMVNIQKQIVFIAVFGYLVFAVSNNMFSSKKDMEGAVYLLPLIFLILAGGYLTGIRISLTGQALNFIQIVLGGLAKSLGIVIVVNFGLLFLGSTFLKLTSKNFKIKYWFAE